MTDEQPGNKKRSKRIYIYWGAALALLLGLGVFSWLVVSGKRATGGEPIGGKRVPKVRVVFPIPTRLETICTTLTLQTEVTVSCEAELARSLLIVSYDQAPLKAVVRELAVRVGAKPVWDHRGNCRLVKQGKGKPLLKETNLDLRGKRLKTVCDALAKLGVKVTCDKGLENRPVRLKLKRLPLSSAVRHIAKQAGARAYVLPDGNLHIGARRSDREVPPLVRPRTPGKLNAEKNKELERLLPRLGAQEWRERRSAEKAISRLGPGALPKLRRHLRVEQDPEVRERIQAAITGLENAAKCPLRRAVESQLTEDTLSVAFAEEQVAHILDFVRQRSKANIVVDASCRKALAAARITLNMDNVTVAAVLDATLAQCGLSRDFVDGAIYVTEAEKQRRSGIAE